MEFVSWICPLHPHIISTFTFLRYVLRQWKFVHFHSFLQFIGYELLQVVFLSTSTYVFKKSYLFNNMHSSFFNFHYILYVSIHNIVSSSSTLRPSSEIHLNDRQFIFLVTFACKRQFQLSEQGDLESKIFFSFLRLKTLNSFISHITKIITIID